MDGLFHFLSWYRQLLDQLLFPYILLYFREIIFALVPLMLFIWGKAP